VDAGVQFRPIDLAWGPLIWLVAVGFQIAALVVVVAAGIPFTSNTEGVSDVPADRGYVIALLILAVVAAPIVEELMFRGIVLRGLLSRMGAVWAVLVQGVLFGAAHVDPVRGMGNIGLVIALSAVGIALGGAAVLLRRVPACMIAHAIFNGVVMVVVLLEP
jgi:membrane protease YdiL (CAAX protease family)